MREKTAEGESKAARKSTSVWKDMLTRQREQRDPGWGEGEKNGDIPAQFTSLLGDGRLL